MFFKTYAGKILTHLLMSQKYIIWEFMSMHKQITLLQNLKYFADAKCLY